jgi:hypothetical protein
LVEYRTFECATLALLHAQYRWLSDRRSADNSSKTPTLRRISAVDRWEAYLARLANGSDFRPSRAQRLAGIKEEESVTTTDFPEDRDAQPRVSYLTEVDEEFIVDNLDLAHLKHRDSLSLYQEGINGEFYARRRSSFFESYQDPRFNDALEAYRMRRSSTESSQIDVSSNFNVDQESVAPIVARAISESVRSNQDVEFPPPPEKHLQTTQVCPRTHPRWNRHRRNLPGTHRNVRFHPSEFENAVLAPPARQEQNQAFFAVIGAVLIVVSGSVVSNNNNIVIVFFYLLLLFLSFLAVFTDSFMKNNVFWRN